MINKLKNIEKGVLMDLLADPSVWTSLDIDYHPPVVKRLFTTIGNSRLYLHEIKPCDTKDALTHPHPWESAMHVLPFGEGIYEHGIGTKDEILCTQQVHGEMYYEMMSKDAYHYVRPIDEPVFTLMLAGPPKWNENSHKADKELTTLSDDEIRRVLDVFQYSFKAGPYAK